jgi:hypothetical protein
MDKEEVEYIENLVNKDSKVFEWGSGGSTIYFYPLVHTYISVENIRLWYELVRQRLIMDKVQGITKRNNNTILIYIDERSDYIENKKGRGSIKDGVHLKKYVNSIDETNIDDFDLILIDGDVRANCLLKAIQYATENTTIILHDYYKYHDSYKWIEKNYKPERPIKESNMAVFRKKNKK